MRADIFPDSTGTRRIYLVIGFLIVLAWSLLAAWQRSTYAEWLGHEVIEQAQFPLAWHVGTFVLSWILMTVAMMLPGNLPLLIRSAHSYRQQIAKTWEFGWIILGYLASWVLFGLLVYAGDSVLHHLLEPGAPRAAYSDLISPAIVLVAGLYQFTPVKHRFMERCQISPALVLEREGEKSIGAGALKQGLLLGFFCVGSCWSLMLLLFALGHHRLDWMAALGVILAAERLASWRHYLAWVVGMVLLVWFTSLILTTL